MFHAFMNEEKTASSFRLSLQKSAPLTFGEKMYDNKERACHTLALPFTLKKYFKAKEELWKLKYFTMQKYNLSKNPLKKPKYFKKLELYN
jgi:hypothetical protein